MAENWLNPLVSMVVLCWGFWFITQMQVWQHRPPQPGLYLGLAIVSTGFAAIKLGRLFGVFQNLNRGERGECLVAEQLEELRAMGYRSFHDIQCDGYNIDHVVVGSAGVFVIETKFRSGQGLIEFRNGEGLFVDGRPEEKDCLKQARGNAAEMNRIIQEHCKMYQWVKPLVVFVGNWRVNDRWLHTDARVISVSRIQEYFRAQDQPVLTRHDRFDRIASGENGERYAVVSDRGRMVSPQAWRGLKAGSRFWGWRGFPKCRGTREIGDL